jgi:hypothetical protein
MKTTRSRRCRVVYGDGWHLYLWRRGIIVGFHHTRRVHGGLWRHHRVRLFEPSPKTLGRGTRTWEWDSWLTTRAGSGSGAPKFRVGLKTFIRFKVGFGGRVTETQL